MSKSKRVFQSINSGGTMDMFLSFLLLAGAALGLSLGLWLIYCAVTLFRRSYQQCTNEVVQTVPTETKKKNKELKKRAKRRGFATDPKTASKPPITRTSQGGTYAIPLVAGLVILTLGGYFLHLFV